ncbi:MAG: hypothetical protein Fur0041_04410 [Bacteroidia bacterium]
MRLSSTILAIFIFLLTGKSFAQTPTNQDCLGAIPICQNVYSTTVSYSGEGNFPNEINSNISCLGSGELNDVWYTFTVQQSGNLNFLITPNNSSDDYDWAVYNLTNANCSNIFTNPALQVSCNFSGTPGTTGPNGGSGFNSQNAIGTPYNAVIPVTQGQTYVINVSNFSSTQFGYTIDFSASTAVIFDQVPPQIQSVNNPGCGANTLTVTFSENILCNTVQASDFSFTGPGGPYTVTSVTSAACAAGAQYDNQFTLTISPSITNAGTYTANLTGPVTDLCGNVAIFPAQLPFNVGSFTINKSSTPANCANNNGTATVSITGTGPFTYVWSPNVSSTNTASGLAAGIYTVTITDQSTGCWATDTIHVNANNTLVATPTPSSTVCPNQSTSLTVVPSGGTAPFNYQWSNALPNQQTVQVSPAVTTTYTVTASDGCGQTAQQTVDVFVQQLPEFSFSADTTNGCTPLRVQFIMDTSGFGNVTYLWNFDDAGATSTSAVPYHTFTTAGCHDVSLTITAPPGCAVTQTVPCMINTLPQPTSAFTATPTFTDINNPTIEFDNNSTGGNNHIWNFGNSVTSGEWSPTYTYETPGIYPVTLIVTNSFGCSDTAYETITVNDYHTFYVPNAFTPDENGNNDVFKPEYTNILSDGYRLMIFNRWGNLIFESHDPTIGWNGKEKNSGAPAQQDVYVYKIEYTDNMYRKHQLTGHLSLIR